MDKSQERARMGEDNVSDQHTDVTRDERRQRADDANNPDNTATSAGADDQDSSRNADAGNSGSHQEGQYDKQSGKPMTDSEGAPRD